MRASRTTAACAIGATVLALIAASGPASAAPTPGDGAASVAAPDAGRHAVTLITGDRVLVTDRTDGTHEVSVVPGTGRERMQFFRQTSRDAAGLDQLRVLPADAVPLWHAGRLDPRLFDVLGLIRQGYDDRAEPTMPLIVRYEPGAARAALAGATLRRTLPSINGAALREPKSAAGGFWTSLTGSGRGLAGGVAKVWLDGRARLLDEESNAQIGVPVAWQAGYTGKGVTVAVLDGGYDPTHPDLAGVVAADKDFTGSPVGTKDEFGHGTHVASTIAGNGAASGGRQKGVAPDARLVVGRVCGTRFCDDSAILAGMEWAATEQHAKVVNMSLGSDAASDGTDPLAVAVNTLTASTGTLFVTAAGNAGQPRSVGSPAAADAALAVASVGHTDALSSFSSRGPRVGDLAVKPDIAAPGEDIVGARAAGTSLGDPVDEFYTRASGTSMATPHVAGAAAILAQVHPDWTPARLKAALMSTAVAVADATVYEQGAGRVDVARAVTQPVRVEPASLSFGLLRWPFADGPPVSRTVTYHNDGDTAVSLSLGTAATDPTGEPAAAGAFTLASSTVTVPAHGSTDVAVTQHPDALGTARVGSFSGRLTATGAGGITVQAALGVSTERESYDVAVKLVDRNGKAPDDNLPQLVDFTLLDQTNGARGGGAPPIVNGAATIRLPKGTYGVTSIVVTENPEPPNLLNGTVAAVPALVVDHPGIALTFDARRGRPVDALVDAKGAEHLDVGVTLQLTVKTDNGDVASSAGIGGGPGTDLFAIPTRGRADHFAFGYDTVMAATVAGLDRTYYLSFPVLGRIPADPRFRVHDARLHIADANYHAQGVPAAIADRVEFPFSLPGQTFASAPILALTMPTRRLELHSGAPVRWSGSVFQQYLPGQPKGFFEGSIEVPDTVYRTGRIVRQDWNSAVFGPDLSNVGSTNSVSRTGNLLSSFVSSFAPGDAGHAGPPFFDFLYVSGTATLSRDGAVLATRPNPTLSSFALPADTGTYTLALVANRSRTWTTIAPQVKTVWTFTSGPPTTPDRQLLPLPTVKVSGGFDGQDRAPCGAMFPLRLVAATQAGAAASPVRSVSLEFSTDDGQTWQAVRVDRDYGGWRARVPNPACGPTPGFVSLRAKAATAAGTTVEQTVIRAYALAG